MFCELIAFHSLIDVCWTAIRPENIIYYCVLELKKIQYIQENNLKVHY